LEIYCICSCVRCYFGLATGLLVKHKIFLEFPILPEEKYLLTVNVVSLFDNSAIQNGVVEIVSLSRSDQEIIKRSSVNQEGKASFWLLPGKYLIRMKSGFTGELSIDFSSNTEVYLKVLEVLR